MKPTPEQVKEAIAKLEQKLTIKELNKPKNYGIKEGYQKCLEILQTHIEAPINEGVQAAHVREWAKFNAIYRKQLEPIKEMQTVNGRAIAIMCIDWLNGDGDIESIFKIELK
jgi:hypothetical protein